MALPAFRDKALAADLDRVISAITREPDELQMLRAVSHVFGSLAMVVSTRVGHREAFGLLMSVGDLVLNKANEQKGIQP